MIPSVRAARRRSESPTSRNEIFAVEVDSIDDGLLEVDLYLDNRRDERLVLNRAVGVEFTQDHRQTLRNQGVGLLYVPTSQRRAYQRMFTGRLERIYSDRDLARPERMRLIQASCAKMIDDALRCPDRSVPFGLVADVGATFAKWASQDWQGFAHLMDMAEHDYYTVTHTVNVGVGCGLRRVTARAGKQRRHHARYVAELTIIGRFVWQGKDYPVKVGTWTEFQTRDVSRSGWEIVTPWPLAINDVMEFQLPTPGGRKATRMAVVVRVRKTEQNEWSAGLMFVRERPRLRS
jgi:hypothetical protein